MRNFLVGEVVLIWNQRAMAFSSFNEFQTMCKPVELEKQSQSQPSDLLMRERDSSVTSAMNQRCWRVP